MESSFDNPVEFACPYPTPTVTSLIQVFTLTCLKNGTSMFVDLFASIMSSFITSSILPHHLSFKNTGHNISSHCCKTIDCHIFINIKKLQLINMTFLASDDQTPTLTCISPLQYFPCCSHPEYF